MQQQGKFILVTIDEFKRWLMSQKFTRTVKLIQNHHTWAPSYKEFNGKSYFEMVIGMEKYQMGPPDNFAQIAQNLTTFPDGTIMICRPFDIAPAGIKGANSNGICIEHVGNFDEGGDKMNDVHKNTIIQLNALLCKKYNLIPNSNTIVYHHWYDLNSGIRTNGTGTVKTCPGNKFFGGNTVASAEKNFIPLITKALSGIK